MGVIDWRKISRDRDAWKLILKEAWVLHGPYSQWRERIFLKSSRKLKIVGGGGG
jgi:hypothetical protein